MQKKIFSIFFANLFYFFFEAYYNMPCKSVATVLPLDTLIIFPLIIL